jgi:hypothetical protein
MAQYNELPVYKAVICWQIFQLKGILVKNISSVTVASFKLFTVIRHSR